jgi:hypothetical protein
MLRQVVDGRPLLERTAAHDGAGRTDFDGVYLFTAAFFLDLAGRAATATI